MQVTGNMLRAKLQALALVIALAEDQFDNELKQFPDEHKDPVAIDDKIGQLEQQMARLQVAQMRYNLVVTISVKFAGGEQKMTLAYAVKSIGGASRSAKRWRSVAPKKDRYRFSELSTRKTDEQQEQWTLNADEIIGMTTAHAQYAAALQAAIAAGNATVIDLDGLNATDLDF